MNSKQNNPNEHELPSPHKASIIITFCLMSYFLIFLVNNKNFIFGSKAGHWIYKYFPTIIPIPLWIVLTVPALLFLLIFLGNRFISRYETMVLISGLLIAIALQIILNSIYPYSLSEIVRSDVANSFYSPAMKYSLHELLSNYSSLAKTFPLHARTNMPGKILFYQFLQIFTNSPRGMAYLVIAFSTVGGWLLYGICKRLFADRTIAFTAFVLYVLFPSKQYFFPILNTITPVFILLSLYLFVSFIESKRKIFLILLGVSLYILILFEPSPLSTGLIFIAVFLNAVIHRRFSFRDAPITILIPTLSFVLLYAAIRLVFSYDLLQTFLYILRDAQVFNAQSNRGYGVWIGENLKEFTWGAGLPVMLAFIYYIATIFTQWRIDGFRSLLNSSESIFVLSVLLTFCFVLFIGINRGEVTRLWIYLAAFFQIPAAIFMKKCINNRTLFFLVALTIVSQTIIGLQKVAFVAP